jgi:hypothetical protein
VRTGKGEPAVFKISRTDILRTGIYKNTLAQHITFRGKKK